MHTDLSQELISLVGDAQQGDDRAAERIYTLLIDGIYAYFFYRCYNESVAQDLTSETFMAVFEQMHSFDPSRSTNVKGWVYRIAHNKLVDHRRKQKHAPTQFDEDWQMTDYHPDLLEQTNAKMIVDRIGELLEDMHPHAKEIVLMKLREGMSHSEISNELQIAESNVRKIFSRSLKKLLDQGDDLLVSILLFGRIGGR